MSKKYIAFVSIFCLLLASNFALILQYDSTLAKNRELESKYVDLLKLLENLEDKGLGISLDICCVVEQWRRGILLSSHGDTEVLTNIGKNFTAMKLSGDSSWNYVGDMLENITYLGWGYGTPTSSSVALPNQRTRFDVAANFTYISTGTWNYTGYWYPSSDSVTNCTGMFWESSGNYLFCYDVFGEINYTTDDILISKWQFSISYS